MFNVNKPKEKLILNDDVDEDLIQEDHEVQQAEWVCGTRIHF